MEKNVKQYWNKRSLSDRNVLGDGLVWKAKLCAKLPESKEKWPISSEMAAVQGHTHGMEVSTSWSQSLKCPVLGRLAQVTSHHLLAKSNHNHNQQKNFFKRSSRHPLPTCLLSNTGKRENPQPWQHNVATDSLCSINVLNDVLEGGQYNAKWSLKRFSNNSLTDIYCKLHST